MKSSLLLMMRIPNLFSLYIMCVDREPFHRKKKPNKKKAHTHFQFTITYQFYGFMIVRETSIHGLV